MPRVKVKSTGCLICSTRAGCEQNDLLLQVYACDSCTTVFVRNPYIRRPPTQLVKCTGSCLCTLCAVQQAVGTKVRKLRICTVCLIDCQSKVRASAHDPKESFLQQFDNCPQDVSFVVEGTDERIPAHRFILASKSPVFKRMMEIGMKENLTGLIQIKGMSADVVRAVVKFFYTGEIRFNDVVHPEDVLRFGHQYEIPWLRVLCEIELVKKLSTKNWLEMLSISYVYETEILKDSVRKSFTEIEFDDEILPEVVLCLARQYNIQWLKELCEVKLVKKVTCTTSCKNLLEMLSISYQFGMELLKDKVKECLTEIEFSEEVPPKNVLSLADYYDIPWLKVLCETELVKKITGATTFRSVQEMLLISECFDMEFLKEKAKELYRETELNEDGLLRFPYYDIPWPL